MVEFSTNFVNVKKVWLLKTTKVNYKVQAREYCLSHTTTIYSKENSKNREALCNNLLLQAYYYGNTRSFVSISFANRSKNQHILSKHEKKKHQQKTNSRYTHTCQVSPCRQRRNLYMLQYLLLCQTQNSCKWFTQTYVIDINGPQWLKII